MTSEHDCPCQATEKDVWLEFVDTTTINGLSRIITKNKIRSGIWTVLVIVTFICFGCHFYFMLCNYLDYPLNSQSTLLEEAFVFPDVTICARQPFDSRKVTEKDIGIKQAENFWAYIINTTRAVNSKSALNDVVVRTIANERADLSFTSFKIKEDVYLNILDHIHFCFYNGRLCKLKDFSESKLKDYINCITFHPADRSLTDEGKQNGLQLMMDDGYGFSSNSAFEALYKSNGYEITIHENGTEPNFKKRLFMAQSGQEHDISMTMKMYQKYSTSYKPCLEEIITDQWALNLETPPHDRMSYRRTRDTCEMLELQKLAIEKCGCWRDDFLIPLSEKFGKDKPLCHELPQYIFLNEKIDVSKGTITYNGKEYDVSVNSTIFQEMMKRHVCYTKLKEAAKYNKQLNNCYHNCESISYDANIAVSKFDFNIDNYMKLYESILKNLKLKQTNETVTDLKKLREELGNGTKMLTLKIFPVDLDVVSTEESLAYPLTAFFSDFGGNIGLWIGCTVITMAEVLELFIRLGYLKIKRLRQGKQQNGGKTDGEKGKEDPEAINLTATA